MRRSDRALRGLVAVALLAGTGLTMCWPGSIPAAAAPGQKIPPFVVEPTEGYPGDRVTVSDLRCPESHPNGEITFNRTFFEVPADVTTAVVIVPEDPPSSTYVGFDCLRDTSEVTDPTIGLMSSPRTPVFVSFTILQLPDLSASVSPDTARAGGTVSVSGVGCTTGNTVRVVLGELVVETTADRARFAVDVVVPDLAAGRHDILLQCRDGSKVHAELVLALDVEEGEVTPTSSTSSTSERPPTTGDTSGAAEASGSTSSTTSSPSRRTDGSTPAGTAPSSSTTTPSTGTADSHRSDRSAFVRSLPLPDEIPLTVPSLAVDAALTAFVVSVLLVGFPPELFNTALERLEEHRRQLGRRRRRQRLRGALTHPVMLVPFALVAAAVVAAAAPDAAADAATLRLFVGLAVAIGVTIGLVEGPGVLSAHRRGGSGVVAQLHWAGIAVALGLAGLGHAIGLQPPYVYGLVASLVAVTAARPDAREEGAAALAGAVLVLVVSTAAWFAWASVDAEVRDGGSSVALTVDATLAALVVTGFSSLLFGYLPFRYMDGLPLFRWRRGLWIALWAGTVFVALHVLAHDPTRDELVGDSPRVARWVTVALFVGFGLLSLGFRAMVRQIVATPPPRRATGGVVSPRVRLARQLHDRSG